MVLKGRKQQKKNQYSTAASSRVWVLGYTPIKIIMVVMAKMGALLVRVQFLAMGISP